MKIKMNQKGFTLIELLIVIAIIAILAAIAIPQFSAYRERGVRASMVADARNTATNLEAVFGDCQLYPAVVVNPGLTNNFAESTLPGQCASSTVIVTFSSSKGNTITSTAPAANQWQILIDNVAGSGTGFSPLKMTGGPGTPTPSCTWLNTTAC